MRAFVRAGLDRVSVGLAIVLNREGTGTESAPNTQPGCPIPAVSEYRLYKSPVSAHDSLGPTRRFLSSAG
jgi:hypothetical protein